MYWFVCNLNAASLNVASKEVSVLSNSGSLPPFSLVAVSVEYCFANSSKFLPLFKSVIICLAVFSSLTKICCTVTLGW